MPIAVLVGQRVASVLEPDASVRETLAVFPALLARTDHYAADQNRALAKQILPYQTARARIRRNWRHSLRGVLGDTRASPAGHFCDVSQRDRRTCGDVADAERQLRPSAETIASVTGAPFSRADPTW